MSAEEILQRMQSVMQRMETLESSTETNLGAIQAKIATMEADSSLAGSAAAAAEPEPELEPPPPAGAAAAAAAGEGLLLAARSDENPAAPAPSAWEPSVRLSRASAIAAVNEYGEAWMAQDERRCVHPLEQ